MVRVSGQLNSARTGTPQVRLSRKVTSTTSRCSSTGLVVDDQVRERVRVEPRAVPGVEPVGDHVLRLAGPRLDHHRGDRAVQRRPGRQRGPLGGCLALGGQPDPEQHAVVQSRVRAARSGRRSAVRASPCQRQYMVPSSTGQRVQQRAEVRTGAGSGDQRHRRRCARTPPRGRRSSGSPTPSRPTSALCPATNQPPEFWAWETASERGDPARLGLPPGRGHPVLPRLRDPRDRDPRPDLLGQPPDQAGRRRSVSA